MGSAPLDTNIDGGPAERARRKGVRRRRFGQIFSGWMPKGLFARSLIIIIAPMILLQTVIAFVFMERHWQSVTERLSAAVVRDIAGVVDVIDSYPQDASLETITRIARERLELQMQILPDSTLPPPAPKPFFSILDSALSRQLAEKVGKPYWIDTVGNSDLLEIRIKLNEDVLRVYVRRSRAYASNTHIFLLWMVGASVVLLIIAILFLRNQIRPIQRLAEAAERFGKGQESSDDMKPRGAAEVRRATRSFLEMRARIERAIEQRTAMLAGVSHDLRTVLTRFRLQLAMSPQTDETREMVGDVDAMQSMLEGYLDFARGDAGEASEAVDVPDLLKRFEMQAGGLGKTYTYHHDGPPTVQVRPVAFGRLLDNLVTNALRYADRVEVRSWRGRSDLVLEVHDNGPGIAEEDRELVFGAFVRLDAARNLDQTGTGLGLSIARDIAHGHGGEITLSDSDLGGLCARVVLPV